MTYERKNDCKYRGSMNELFILKLYFLNAMYNFLAKINENKNSQSLYT